jgi:hypothetical protein
MDTNACLGRKAYRQGVRLVTNMTKNEKEHAKVALFALMVAVAIIALHRLCQL